MHRAVAYQALALELERWRSLPEATLVANIGKPASVQTVNIGGEQVSIEVMARWQGSIDGAVRVTGVANGPSHWRLERLEESIVVRLSGN
jgi:hypothetical protein